MKTERDSIYTRDTLWRWDNQLHSTLVSRI